MPSERAPATPQHVSDAIDQIAKMQVSHHREATKMERVTDRVTSVLGTSTFLFCVAGFTLAPVAYAAGPVCNPHSAYYNPYDCGYGSAYVGGPVIGFGIGGGWHGGYHGGGFGGYHGGFHGGGHR